MIEDIETNKLINELKRRGFINIFSGEQFYDINTLKNLHAIYSHGSYDECDSDDGRNDLEITEHFYRFFKFLEEKKYETFSP